MKVTVEQPPKHVNCDTYDATQRTGRLVLRPFGQGHRAPAPIVYLLAAAVLTSGCPRQARPDRLLRSARKGDIPSLRELIASGVDVNSRGRDGYTALMAAVEGRGGSEVVAWLLSRGARLDLANDYGSPALHIAASIGDAKSLELLVSAGADVNQTNAFTGETPLLSATALGHAGAIQFLLRNGADVRAVDDFGLSALHLATASSSTCLRLLLEWGAPPDARSRDGLTPLLRVLSAPTRSERERCQMVSLLLKHGADPTCSYGGTEGPTPDSHVGLRRGGERPLRRGDSPLDVARRFGFRDVEELLRRHLEDTEGEGKEGVSD